MIFTADREDLPQHIYEPFLEKNKIFSTILFFLTIIAVVYLFVSKDDLLKTNSIKIPEIDLNKLPNDSIDVDIINYPGMNELHNEIDSFLNQDKLEPTEASTNVDKNDPNS